MLQCMYLLNPEGNPILQVMGFADQILSIQYRGIILPLISPLPLSRSNREISWAKELEISGIIIGRLDVRQ